MTADQLCRPGLSHPVREPDVSAKVTRGEIRGWMSRKHEE
jgi:hypothetical protein